MIVLMDFPEFQQRMMPDTDDDSHDHLPRDERPSRSQRRREALDVLKLAHALAALSDAQLAPVPLDDDLRAEVARTRAVKQQIARKRAEQFLAKQLRKLDDAELEPLRAALEHDRGHARREAAALHRIEHWRECLLAGGDDALAEFMREFPQADRQRLRQLARRARAEREAHKPLHAFHELFRLLRDMPSADDSEPQTDITP
jgi:ribosome-associated protein